jgi:hypothetical protein
MGKSKYTSEMAEAVLEELRAHGSTLKAAKAVGLDRSTIVKWTESDPDFEQQYARAKLEGIDALVEDTIEISDQSPTPTAQGNIDTGAVQHARLRIETRRWYAERLAARKYGVLSRHELSGVDGGPVAVVDETAKAARVAQLLAIAQSRKEEQGESNPPK